MKRNVKWEPGMTSADFLRAVIEAGGLRRGEVTHLAYYHDDWCPKAHGRRGECVCDPDVVATIGGLPDYLDPPKAA